MKIILFLVVIASAAWVYQDAQKIGIRKGMSNGFFDMGPAGWAFSILLLWILAFPLYLIKRGDLASLESGLASKEERTEPRQSGINVAAKIITVVWTVFMAIFTVLWLYNLGDVAPVGGNEYELAGFGIGITMGAGLLFFVWAGVAIPAAIIYMITKKVGGVTPAVLPQEVEETKKCPFCAETIKADAKFCRFCSHDLPPQKDEPAPQSKKKHWEEQGKTEYQNGDYILAVASFTRSLEYEESAHVLYLRAAALSKMGEKEKALEDLKTAAAMGHVKASAALMKIEGKRQAHKEVFAKT